MGLSRQFRRDYGTEWTRTVNDLDVHRGRSTAATDPAITRRWWIWFAAGAVAFLVGVAAVAIDGDDDPSTAVWATRLISWAAAVVLAVIGIGVAAATAGRRG